MVLLATIYGEQDGEKIDWKLADRNVRVWNAWATQGMSEEEIAELRVAAASDLEGAGEWDGLHTGVVTAFEQRLSANSRLPNPSDTVDFSNTEFANTIVLANSVFTQDAWFLDATFTQDAYFGDATFTQDAKFRDATFTQDANFRAATFFWIHLFCG